MTKKTLLKYLRKFPDVEICMYNQHGDVVPVNGIELKQNMERSFTTSRAGGKRLRYYEKCDSENEVLVLS